MPPHPSPSSRGACPVPTLPQQRPNVGVCGRHRLLNGPHAPHVGVVDQQRLDSGAGQEVVATWQAVRGGAGGGRGEAGAGGQGGGDGGSQFQVKTHTHIETKNPEPVHKARRSRGGALEVAEVAAGWCLGGLQTRGTRCYAAVSHTTHNTRLRPIPPRQSGPARTRAMPPPPAIPLPARPPPPAPPPPPLSR